MENFKFESLDYRKNCDNDSDNFCEVNDHDDNMIENLSKIKNKNYDFLKKISDRAIEYYNKIANCLQEKLEVIKYK
jgi:hypothetical protein